MELSPDRGLPRRARRHGRRARTWRTPTGLFPQIRSFQSSSDTPVIRGIISTIILTVIGLALVVPASLLTAYFYFARDVPPPAQIVNRPVPQTTKIYDRNGVLLAELSDPNKGQRTVVPLKQLPPYLIDAAVAIEDPTFYTNPGINPLSVARAAFENATHHQIVSGASTLTQQLARNLLWNFQERQSKSIARKVKEAIFAVRLTQTYSKDQILAMYFNTVYYGNRSYGIEAASRNYFGKSASQLDLAESAMLAGLPQAPSSYDPLLHQAIAKRRQAEVLDAMVKHGYITVTQASAAKAEPLHFTTQQIPYHAPHWINYVTQWLEHRYGYNAVYDQGWRIQTTLDLGLNRLAQQKAQERIAQIQQKMNAHDACVVAIQPQTGEILAMVGSLNYWDKTIDGQINTCIAPRQGGSSVKVFNYLTAFEQGYVPDTVVNDVQTAFSQGPGRPPYIPKEFTNTYNGPVTLRDALGSSLNVPAVKLLEQIGSHSLSRTAHAMGVTSLNHPDQYGLTLTLGASNVTAVDMAFAYSVLANDGSMVGEPVPLKDRQLGQRPYEPVCVLKITDAAGNVVYQYQPPKPIQVVSPQAAYLISNVLTDDRARHFDFGRHQALWLGFPAAVKTGTTQFYQDTWTDGYVPAGLAVSIWVGNANGDPMTNTFSLLTAAAIWHSFMPAAMDYLHLPREYFKIPPGVAYGQVCGKQDWYIQGIAPICSVGNVPAQNNATRKSA